MGQHPETYRNPSQDFTQDASGYLQVVFGYEKGDEVGLREIRYIESQFAIDTVFQKTVCDSYSNPRASSRSQAELLKKFGEPARDKFFGLLEKRLTVRNPKGYNIRK